MLRKSFSLTMILSIALLAIGPFNAAARLQSSHIFYVNSKADSRDANPGDGICADSERWCSLRAAVQEANATPETDTIILYGGTYSLDLKGTDEDDAFSGDLDILAPLILLGDNAEYTVIDGELWDRVIHIPDSGTQVTIAGVTIRQGAVNEEGGGILNNGSLSLKNCSIKWSEALTGGGIVNNGTASIDNCSIFGNESRKGGGVYNTGSMTIKSSNIDDNDTEISGGGIINLGTMEINSSQVNGNYVSGYPGANGGGIANGGTLTIKDSTISSNIVDRTMHEMDSWGGGISNGGGLTISDTSITNNFASNGGGGIENKNAAVLSNVTISSNLVTDRSYDRGGVFNEYAQGGGIRNLGTLRIQKSFISENIADPGIDNSAGGGIRNTGNGVAVVSECEFSGNQANWGGAVHNDDQGEVWIQIEPEDRSFLPGSTRFSGNSSTSDAGAIFNENTLKVNNTTFTGNHAGRGGGALVNWTPGKTEVWNSTFTQNDARNGGAIDNAGTGMVTLLNATLSGNSASEFGGAIVNYNEATLDILYSTFAENRATNGSAIGNLGGPVTVGKSILQLPPLPSTGTLCNVYLTSTGWNVASDTSCGLSQTGDQQGRDPKLSALADHGGPTPTHALLPGSPAIDLIPLANCSVYSDQRGVKRPQGIGCDAGSYEFSQARLLIDIRPGRKPNQINWTGTGTVPVAILSKPAFDAPARVRWSSLRFGRTGWERSLLTFDGKPDCWTRDVNGDGRLDLVCRFRIPKMNFTCGDTAGIMRGMLKNGKFFSGKDSVVIIGCQ